MILDTEEYLPGSAHYGCACAVKRGVACAHIRYYLQAEHTTIRARADNKRFTIAISYIEYCDVKHTQEDCRISVSTQTIQKHQHEFNQRHAFIFSTAVATALLFKW